MFHQIDQSFSLNDLFDVAVLWSFHQIEVYQSLTYTYK